MKRLTVSAVALAAALAALELTGVNGGRDAELQYLGTDRSETAPDSNPPEREMARDEVRAPASAPRDATAPAAAVASDASPRLLRVQRGSTVYPRDGEPQVIRRAALQPDGKALNRLFSSLPSFPLKLLNVPSQSRSFALDLFEDVAFEAVIESVAASRAGGFIVRGRLKGVEGGTFTLVQERGVTVADISAGARIFEIRAGKGGHSVSEIDPSRLPEDDPLPGSSEYSLIHWQPTAEDEADYDRDVAGFDQTQDLPGLNSAAAETPVQDAAYTQIDLLVAYTPSAVAAMGGASGVDAFVQMAVDKANQTYQNSLINQRLRLVGTLKLSGNETGSAANDLKALSGTSDGAWDEVHAARQKTGADAVSLLASNLGSGVCGIGYLNSGKSSAFSMVKTSCVSNHTFTHELGHNMGAAHDRANASSAPFSYGYGYIDSANGFRTVMAYASGSTVRVAHLSNPLQNYKNAPTGTANADNARVLNQTRTKLAAFLNETVESGQEPPAPMPTPAPTPAPPPAPATCGIKVLRPGAGDSLARGQSFQLTWMPGTGEGYVRILLVQNGSPVTTLDSLEANDGYMRLRVPRSVTPGTGFAIRVMDRANAACFDDSDGGFRIQ